MNESENCGSARRRKVIEVNNIGCRFRAGLGLGNVGIKMVAIAGFGQIARDARQTAKRKARKRRLEGAKATQPNFAVHQRGS